MMASSNSELRSILQSCRVIAVAGLSPKPDRPSYGVAKYLLEHGFCVIPVHPLATEILGQKCYPSLTDIPVPVDLVDVFRRPEHVMPICDGAIAIGARCLWRQLGVVNAEAAAKAVAAGLDVVMDRCVKIDYERLCSGYSLVPGKP